MSDEVPEHLAPFQFPTADYNFVKVSNHSLCTRGPLISRDAISSPRLFEQIEARLQHRVNREQQRKTSISLDYSREFFPGLANWRYGKENNETPRGHFALLMATSFTSRTSARLGCRRPYVPRKISLNRPANYRAGKFFKFTSRRVRDSSSRITIRGEQRTEIITTSSFARNFQWCTPCSTNGRASAKVTLSANGKPALPVMTLRWFDGGTKFRTNQIKPCLPFGITL